MVDVRLTDEIGIPRDWTNGAGSFSTATGSAITIPANLGRQWFFAQSQDVGGITINYQTSGFSNVNGTAVSGVAGVSTVYLGGGTSSGSQGGADERTQPSVPTGAITVTGTVGQKVCIMEG